MPKTVELQFPLKGLVKDAAFQRQAPYSSPSLSNVRPSDTYAGRDRGGSRPGIAKVFAAQLGSGNPIRLLNSVTYIPAGGSQTTIAVASANGTFYRESAGNLSAYGGSTTLASNVPLQSVERGQKIYIADYSVTPIASGTDGVVSGGTSFDSATYADWTVIGMNVNDYVVNITSGTSAGVYRIASFIAGAITLFDTAPNGSANTFRIERGPKVYDPAANTLTLLWATAGTVPIGCTMVALFRDRLIWSGGKDFLNNVVGSRVAGPTDYNYSAVASDTTGAFALSATQAGLLGDPVTALIPHGDGCMIIGCTKSLYSMQNDPRRGGRVVPVSPRVGPVSAKSWCRTPSGWLFFVSFDGLYAMPSGCGSTPMGVSRDTLPGDLLGIDQAATTVTMGYDLRDRGIHLFLSTVAGSVAATHYWITTDTERAGGPEARFFPSTYPVAMEPTALFSRDDSTDSNSVVYLGGRDGYLRNHRGSQTTDDGTSIASSVMIGPIGAPLFDVMMKELVGILGGSSGGAGWSLHVGDTPETAVATSDFDSGTWSAGLSFTERPRARGAAIYLKLSATGRWALERVDAVIERLGRTRL